MGTCEVPPITRIDYGNENYGEPTYISDLSIRSGKPGLPISDCYFHGVNPRGTPGHDYTWVQRGVNLHGCDSATIQDCTVLRYPDGFMCFFDCEEPDVHHKSHHILKPDTVGALVSKAGKTRNLLSAGEEYNAP